MFALDRAPDDIRYAYGVPSERTAGLRDLAMAFRRGGSVGRRWDADGLRQATADAFHALLRSGALAERAAIKEIDAGLDRRIARRQALAEFIAARGPGQWRMRLGRALWVASVIVERGA